MKLAALLLYGLGVPQVQVADYYIAYNKLRRAVNQMVQFRGAKLSEFVEYQTWKGADEKLLADVGNIGAMYEAISEINKRHHYPVAMAD